MRRHEIRDLSVHKKSNFFVSKRASMQLSINAIVILVMAMAVLGIGLGLIRGVLAPAEDNLKDALGKVDLDQVATSSKPIANIPRTVNMKIGSANQMAISYYNADTDDCNDEGAEFTISCALDGDEEDVPREQSLSVDVPLGTAQTLIATFKPESGTFSGTAPCKVNVMCGSTDGGSVATFINFNS